MRTSPSLVAAALLILSVAPARPQAIGEWGRIVGGAKPPAPVARPARPVPAPAPAPGTAKPARPVALADSALALSIVRQLADPALEGRGASTAGIEKAATLIRSEMERIGLRPAGPGDDWGEPFEVTTGVEVSTPSFITVAGRRLDEGADYEPLGFSTNGTLRAPVVFAGYGITAPGFDYDDYAGLDVRDRIVLVLTNEPGEMDSTSRFDGAVNTPHAELRTKAINAREHGALGLVVVNGPRWHAGEPLRRPRADGGGYMSGGLLAAQLSDSVADRLVLRAGQSLVQAQMGIDSLTRPHSFALPDSVTLTVTLKRTRSKVRNVVGMIPGRDTTRTLVVGAHYDHLGYGGESSRAPDQRVPHVGADDNASGTAALLGTAGLIAQRMKTGWRPEHTLLFCSFTGEEMGVVGSSRLVDDPPRPLESVEAMLNMDMVGRLRDDRLMVMGVGTAEEFPALIENANRAAGFQIKTSSDGYGPSDHSSFYKKKIPVLMLFTGAHADYHKPSDTWDKINQAGLWRVTRFAAALVESLDARPRPRFVQAKSDSGVGRIAGGGGYGASLGTIPDYMQTEGGVLLSGVRSGSPAEQAGLRQGDVVVKFDGVGIDNIYDYTFALRSRKPGQPVSLTVKRDGVLVTLNATLGRRP